MKERLFEQKGFKVQGAREGAAHKFGSAASFEIKTFHIAGVLNSNIGARLGAKDR